MCDWRLHCGHQCINKCHNIVLHQEVFCREDCTRTLAGCDQAYQLPYGATCGPCKVQLYNIELPCGHVQASLDCYLAQNPALVKCQSTVLAQVPVCGHAVEQRCYQSEPGPNYLCRAVCGELLACGHACKSQCHTCKPRNDSEIPRTNHSPCKTTCGGTTICAVILANKHVTARLLVDFVQYRVKYAALIPGVRNLAPSLVLHARRIAHGNALILGDAIYFVLFPATIAVFEAARERFGLWTSVSVGLWGELPID